MLCVIPIFGKTMRHAKKKKTSTCTSSTGCGSSAGTHYFLLDSVEEMPESLSMEEVPPDIFFTYREAVYKPDSWNPRLSLLRQSFRQNWKEYRYIPTPKEIRVLKSISSMG